jgi:hypothetical protein
MSVPAYITVAMFTVLVLFGYVVNPSRQYLITALPMLILLAVLPLLLTEMSRRLLGSVDTRGARLYKIKDLSKLETGTTVRIRGTVEKTSFKWLNRPHFVVNDGSGEIGVVMFAAPREDIKPGDQVEAVGTIRSFGATKSKKEKILGIQMRKLS